MTRTPGWKSAPRPRRKSRTSSGARADEARVTAITIQGVARAFGTVQAVDNVSIAVHDGEFFTLLGPSGCGKTTLLRMVAGFCELDTGRIMFGGERIDALPPHKRNTGMVFQNYAVFPNLTVGGNVAYGLRARSIRGDELAGGGERAPEIVQLQGYRGRWAHPPPRRPPPPRGDRPRLRLQPRRAVAHAAPSE